MKLSNRDKWLVAILPGLFALIAYQYGVAGKLGAEIKGLREQTAAAAGSGSAKSAHALSAALAEADRIDDELQKEKAKGSSSAAVFPEMWKDSDRSRTLQELSRYFEESGVQLLNSSFQKEAGAGEGALQELARGLKERYGAPAPQYWKFELTGTYARMSELLRKLGESPRFIVPVTVDMKVEDETPELTWTVVLWI